MTLQQFIKDAGIKSLRQLAIQLGYPEGQAGQAIYQATRRPASSADFMHRFASAFPDWELTYNLPARIYSVAPATPRDFSDAENTLGGYDTQLFSRKNLLTDLDDLNQNPAVYAFVAATGLQSFWVTVEEYHIVFSDGETDEELGRFPIESLANLRRCIQGQ